MIKISILRLTPNGVDISGEEPSEFLDLENDENISSISPVYYELRGQLIDNGVLVTGKLNTILTCRCAVCLEKYELNLKKSQVTYFYENPNKNEIDLTDDIREDIIIRLPQRFLCSNACKGLCFNCGQNLNIKKCSCKQVKEQGDIWEKLDQLK